MAVMSSHPISTPPAAPVRATTGHLLLRGWCIFVLASGLAGTAWLMAFGVTGSAVAMALIGVVSAALWVARRADVPWRRLPWFVVGYIVWAVCSLVWSAYPGASATTLALLLVTTVCGLLVATVLTWREAVTALASAIKWILGLSLLFELWVSLVWGGPILPQFVRPERPVDDPIVLWCRDNLFDGGRIQGLFGNANALAYVALLGMIVFAVRFVSRAPRRPLLVLWFALSAFLFYRAGSATAYLAALGVLVVLATVLLMRTTTRPGQRTRYYAAFAVVGLGGLGVAWFARDTIFTLLGRSADLTGRETIWAAVAERAGERPWTGWGFATPWMPSDPFFDEWIVDHGVTVMQAHNMWLDVALQLGAVGVVLMVLLLLAFVWRSWFFAVDRPRWDLVADRPYSSVTLVPTLLGALLIVQGLAESTPLLNWGWMLIVLFAFKIKCAPLVGRGPSEQRLIGEQGEQLPGT
ncbi:O-antigen ligase family protein [Microbacterium sp. No. 7]|uniref:O-antigen ligase family protein n=1 Tax=Microbacterium sp. No. 7 TaxID=1714373 RepID=UPI0006D1AD72|nr:O-antigen ligase family protein [Microbacterium sp. No. 7]ALJ19403.1 ligase [Microbacterium sp. No. 7]